MWLTQFGNNLVVEEGGRIICTMNESPCPRQVAEKTVISAAPELLIAIKRLVNVAAVMCDLHPAAAVLVEVVGIGRAAIQKAEPEGSLDK